MAVVIVSTKVNMESKPRVRIMTKNKNDISCGTWCNLEMASGKAMKANPGPLLTTSLMHTLSSLAMNPRMEKTTSPAKIDVPQLMKETRKASR